MTVNINKKNTSLTHKDAFSSEYKKLKGAEIRVGNSHAKPADTLVVSLRVVNCRFGTHLGCSGQNANV